MDTQELKQKMQRDIERLKTLDVDILERKNLYPEAFKWVKASYYKFLLSYFVTLIPLLLFHWKFQDFFNYTSDFLYCAAFILLFHVLAFSNVTLFIIVKKTVFPKLETGEFLYQTIISLRRTIVTFFITIWGLFTLVAWIVGARGLIGGYLIAGIATWLFAHIIISNEMNRLGISGLFSLITSLVNRGKIEPDSINSSNQSTTGRTSAFYDPADIGDYRNPQSPFNPNHPFNSNSTKQD